MNAVSDLLTGAWDVITHFFDSVPNGEGLFWAALTIGIIVSVAWTEATRQG